jgi:hypothetical protein
MSVHHGPGQQIMQVLITDTKQIILWDRGCGMGHGEGGPKPRGAWSSPLALEQPINLIPSKWDEINSRKRRRPMCQWVILVLPTSSATCKQLAGRGPAGGGAVLSRAPPIDPTIRDVNDRATFRLQIFLT